jgi:hypothetical protein
MVGVCDQMSVKGKRSSVRTAMNIRGMIGK